MDCFFVLSFLYIIGNVYICGNYHLSAVTYMYLPLVVFSFLWLTLILYIHSLLEHGYYQYRHSDRNLIKQEINGVQRILCIKRILISAFKARAQNRFSHILPCCFLFPKKQIAQTGICLSNTFTKFIAEHVSSTNKMKYDILLKQGRCAF